MLSENIIDDLEQIEDESSHVLHFWSPFDTNVTKNYNFVPNSLLFNIPSYALLSFACFVLSIFNKIAFGFKIIGKENLKSIKGRKSNSIKPCSSNGLYNGWNR